MLNSIGGWLETIDCQWLASGLELCQEWLRPNDPVLIRMLMAMPKKIRKK